MRRTISLAAFGALLVGASQVRAQDVLPSAADPGVVGPARRAAAAANPNVEQRIENREQRRDIIRAEAGNPNAAARAELRANTNAAARPDQWRYRYHNNRWWYYTPQNTWIYYYNNAWTPYVVPEVRTGDGYYYNNGYYNRRFYNNRGFRGGYWRGGYGPAATPYSNGTPAGNFGSNLGAEIGAAAGGAQGANTGAAIGGAIGNPIGAGNNPPPAPPPNR